MKLPTVWISKRLPDGRDTSRFAVEFNLTYPLQLTMPGLNKDVFSREGMPIGLYHAIFQFDDGSTSAPNFSIVE